MNQVVKDIISAEWHLKGRLMYSHGVGGFTTQDLKDIGRAMFEKELTGTKQKMFNDIINFIHNTVISRNIQSKQEEQKPKVLHCYSKGDIRFSAFGAKVVINSYEDTIEFWYQLSKKFADFDRPPQTAPWKTKMEYTRKVKAYQKQGHEPESINVLGKEISPNYLSAWYKMLWISYLQNNPKLVEYASKFDEFLDIYGKNSKNNQAHVIRDYVKHGREFVMKDCKELIKLLKS